MDLLQAGVDRSVIALWLGHESVETTQIYLEATLAMKEQALAKTPAPGSSPVAIGLAISCLGSSTACRRPETMPSDRGWQLRFQAPFRSDSASNRPSLGIVRDPA